MKKIIFITLFAFLFQVGFTQKLSDEAFISLLTIEQGTELYSAFGHSAIRICDPQQNMDIAFNYGTFDFNTPGFYMKFVKGELDYMLSVGQTKYFMIYYKEEQRSVFEQKINLTQNEKQEVFDFLRNNALPENKFYRYDFFYKNCASVIRDIFENQFGDKLVFNQKDEEFTFKDLLHQYLKNNDWGKFGIDLLLGLRSDKKAPTRDYMFLPDYLMYAFDSAEINDNGENRPLVYERNQLYKAENKDTNQGFFTPKYLVWIFFIIIQLLTIWAVKKKKMFWGLDFVLFFIAGIGGLILFLAWFFTFHTVMTSNLNIIWLLPTHFFFAFYMLFNRKSEIFRIYLIVTAVFNALLLVGWGLIPQELNVWFFPIILSLLIRQLYLVYFDKYFKNPAPKTACKSC